MDTKIKENIRYLLGVSFPEKLVAVDTDREALEDADVALFSAPAQHFRTAFTNALKYIPKDAVIVNVAKGIEKGSLKRMSEIAFEIKPDAKYVILSGPSHAEEVGKRLPTTVAVGARDRQLAEYVQDIFITDKFRVYTSDDITQ